MHEELIRIVDTNLDHMIRNALLYIIQLGTKYNIFKVLAKNPSYLDVFSEVDVANKRLLREFILTLIQLGIVEETPDKLMLNGFSYTINIPAQDYNLLLSDWALSLEEIYRMVDFAFITPEHPHILMDFDKDADFWDMRMSNSFAKMYRMLIAKLGNINEKSYVIDIGCGSVSPIDLGSYLGPEGYYLGLDYSPSMIEIAKSRIEEKSMSWVELKEIDAHIIKPVNEYDVAIMSFVLEYIKNPRIVLRKALETLKENGRLVIVEPFRDQFKYIEALEFFEKLNKEFIRFPSTSEITGIIEQEGFDAEINRYGRSALVVVKH
ncbi:class I SAM-dependent methyltransferase [Thermococcus barophilus]|uniref:Methyltransferase n=1 Tax=Thermococcus barophilus TaxID=55802 RepID=A0A0S1XC80_THEBA|nr:class I SAM-dependent methyltransferase [Thermococcus barophilus]ALM75353.1 Methyltransferase [Thermococcus barophilus]